MFDKATRLLTLWEIVWDKVCRIRKMSGVERRAWYPSRIRRPINRHQRRWETGQKSGSRETEVMCRQCGAGLPRRVTNLALYCFSTASSQQPTTCQHSLVMSLESCQLRRAKHQGSLRMRSTYDRWLDKWDTGALTMEESSRKSRGDSVADEKKQMWLNEVDESGSMMMMMMMAVDGAWKGR